MPGVSLCRCGIVKGERKSGSTMRSDVGTPPLSESDSRDQETPIESSLVMEKSGPPPMVGIGASAGGLDAFVRLLEHIPSDTGLSYLFVQHLDPVHESALPEILGRATAIPVIQTQDGMRVEANHAYVIPPNTTMTLTDGHLRLTARKKGGGLHLPIDAFLCSLADVNGNGAIGIILSGTGSDGAQGIQAIKEAGGITIAQESASARYAEMPNSAIATGCVDFILTPEEIAEQLTLLGKQIALQGWNAAADPPVGEEEELRKLFVLLKNRTGVDFQHYRRGTIHRRILRRMLVHRQDTRSDYLAYLQRNPTELDLLYEDLLIGVTNFFRDPEVFETLQTTVFPQLIREHQSDAPIRMWVAGCSGGEETYSLAMALLEFLGETAADTQIQIFGTDVNDSAIARARAGFYPGSITEHVSPERLQRFFIPEKDGYRIAKVVRDLCIFSRQNLVRDPPFSHLDLISCRNVLIYLEPTLQQRVFSIFHYALDPRGVLVLGTAESVRSAGELFVPLVKHHRIYRRRAVATQPLAASLVLPKDQSRDKTHVTRDASFFVRPLAPSAVVDEVEREANRLVLDRFAPAGVVINEHLDVLQFRGRTAAFLQHSAGTASFHLLKLVPPELVMPLRIAIRTANLERRPVREERIMLTGKSIDSPPLGEKNEDVSRSVTIEVLPFQPPSTQAQFFIVLFEEKQESTLAIGSSSIAVDGDKDSLISGSKPVSPRRRRGEAKELSALREELAATRRYLQTITEEHETTQEELRAASEENQSSNEELQSTNEELETTKEEVQSTNEELITVNDELRRRNQELQSIASDLTNVLTSTTIPIVIVDTALHLRRFTPATSRIMRVIATDVGRPLGDIKLLIPLPDIEQQIRRTIETLEIMRYEIIGDDGYWWDLTIRPYLTIDRRVDGAILVFSDIDMSKQHGLQVEEENRTQQELVRIAHEAQAEAVQGREMADEANRAKSIFLTSMSHDLRTPLNAITGYTDLVAMGIRGPVTAEQLQDLSRISHSARHLLALINDILNFAKVEAGHVDFHITDFSIMTIITEMKELITPQLIARSLQFERQNCEENTNTTVVVRADPEKVRQIILNLLTNAVKFTGAGGRIGIDCEIRDDDSGVVLITVWDTGEGIAEEQLSRIFEPFVQIYRGLTSPSQEGVGLGLAISRELARTMNGDLIVESTLGHGSRFTVTLPGGGIHPVNDRTDIAPVESEMLSPSCG